MQTFDFFKIKIQEVNEILQSKGVLCECNDKFIIIDKNITLSKLSAMIFIRKYNEIGEWPNPDLFIDEMRQRVVYLNQLKEIPSISEEVWAEAIQLAVDMKSEIPMLQKLRRYCIKIGIVPVGCIRDGLGLWNNLSLHIDPCLGCDYDKIVCGGRECHGWFFDNYLSYTI